LWIAPQTLDKFLVIIFKSYTEIKVSSTPAESPPNPKIFIKLDLRSQRRAIQRSFENLTSA